MMNIVYAADNNFAEQLGISMLSLLKNNTECDDIRIYILDGGISEENKASLCATAEKYGRNAVFLDSAHLLNGDMKQQRGSLSTFSRLYMGRLLPRDINKALYLDCDLLVLKNIEELYDSDINGYYCAGVGDCVSEAHLKAIGLEGKSNYFNAGVLLINLKMWREENAEKQFEEFSRRYSNDVLYADQGIINGVLSSRSLKLPPEYNCYTAMYDFTYKDLMTFRKPVEYYSETEIESAKNDPAIVHFTTSFLSLRPWVEGCGHPYAEEWQKYKSMSPWATVLPEKDKRSGKKRFAVMAYKLLPNSLAVGIAGILHSLVIPMLKR